MAAFSRIRVISFIITAEGGGRNSTCYDVLKIEGFTGNSCTLGLLGLCSHTPTLAAHRSNAEGQDGWLLRHVRCPTFERTLAK